MRAEEPFARELREREETEPPRRREARRAYERWLTYRRVWAAADRAGVADVGDRAAFICRRLWPDVSDSLVAALVQRVRADEAAGRIGLARPGRAVDVVGPILVDLMREAGYPTEAT
ncbi:MAG TPA: hypothetical protein VF802_09720 [Candidatus Limnocylindrales bacterium]